MPEPASRQVCPRQLGACSAEYGAFSCSILFLTNHHLGSSDSLFLVSLLKVAAMRIAAVLSFILIPLVSCHNVMRDSSPLDSSFELARLLNPLTVRHASNHGRSHRRASRHLQARAAALPPGWTSLGCYSDMHVICIDSPSF